jgi:hypothetical protein
MSSLVDRSNSDGFLLWGHQKKHVHAVPSGTIEDLAELEAAVTAVDAIMLKHI